jgi:hypothetical protein
VHHVVPFALDASKELEPTNLITLCAWLHQCHLKIGHGGEFDRFNPRVRMDASSALLGPVMRKASVKRARESRSRLPSTQKASS